MDKKSKDALRRYKKSRQHAPRSSTESSSTDSNTGTTSSYSSSDSERNRASERHRKKKSRRGISSSGDERRNKRDKRDHCQKKLEAKRNHLKRKLKEAKLKKRAAAAAAALSGHGHRALSPATQAKLKKLAERKHLRAASKERREREREKLRIAAVQRDRDRDHHRLGASRSPPTTTKIRIHQDVKNRQKSPGLTGTSLSTSLSSRMHHQLMSREKIIIQTRTRDRTPSLERDRERQRHEHKLQRHDELSMRELERRERECERAEREAAREKERAEALARCQERQRERERIAREKLQREEEDKYAASGRIGIGGGNGAGSDRLHGSRQLSDRDHLEIGSTTYSSRERSLESTDHVRHINKHEMLDVYDREREDYIPETERHGMLEDLRRYNHRRSELSPIQDHYAPRIRDPRDIYPEEERDRAYKRSSTYIEPRYASSRERELWLNPRDIREREILDSRDFRDIENENLIYGDDREHVLRERERERERKLPSTTVPPRNEWKHEKWDDRDWDDSGGSATPIRPGGFIGGPKRIGHVKPQPQPTGSTRAGSEPNWDTDEQEIQHQIAKAEPSWVEHDQREKPRAWQSNDWRDMDEGYSRSNPGGSSIVGDTVSHHHHHAQHSPTPHHHIHIRTERGGRGGYRRGGSHSDHIGERNTTNNYRPHPPPLMTLPVQPPGGYHSSTSRGFSHKRLTYTNPGFGKKHPHAHTPSQTPPALSTQIQSPQPSNSNKTHQASAVAAATTAVAAAKAAAQSAANATTNPGILGQVSKPQFGSGADTDERVLLRDPASGGELSEISDSDDEILNKTDKTKPKGDLLSDNPLALTQDVSTDTTSNEEQTKPEESTTPPIIDAVAKPDEEEVDDFEEISDVELEEESRTKGIGDALGVDWQALVDETRQHATDITPSPTTSTSGKQRWQPHRVILDLGISLRMAGSHYGQQLLNEARLHQLQCEREITQTKHEIEAETSGSVPNTVQQNGVHPPSMSLLPSPMNAGHNEASIQSETDFYQFENPADSQHIEPLACVQVAVRRETTARQRLFAHMCGSASRALSARQDLKLRRQLSGLPARECTLPEDLPEVSETLKTLALQMFQQRSLDVK